VVRPGAQGSGFEIGGSDGRFVAAAARVRGRGLVVSNAQVAALAAATAPPLDLRGKPSAPADLSADSAVHLRNPQDASPARIA
jgi:hypothetical protein